MTLSYAILGFLEYQPMSGYDLKKYFDQSIVHFWSATQSHIYQALNSLEKENRVIANVIQQEGKPNRKEYRITEEGRMELKRWLSSPLPLTPVREEWLIQLFFAHEVSNEQLAHLLRERRLAIQNKLEELKQASSNIEQRKQNNAPGMPRIIALWQVTLDYGTHFYQSELAWLEKMIKHITSLPEPR